MNDKQKCPRDQTSVAGSAIGLGRYIRAVMLSFHTDQPLWTIIVAQLPLLGAAVALLYYTITRRR